MKNYKKDSLTDVKVTLHHQTEKAWLVSLYGDKDSAVWIPKYAAELSEERGEDILTLPERMAIDKGLV